MEAAHNNLLLRLHKWAHRQDENFLTEAFARLVQHLLEQEPEAAVRLVENFTGGFFKLRAEESRQVELQTQIILAEGTPDLEIRTPRQLAYVEVKSESEADSGQLRRYRRLLSDSGVPSTALILLTRYPAILSEEDERPDAFVRWYQVAEWLEQERNRYSFKAVSDYLVKQFLGFLHVRNMVMGQVTYELASGVRALRTLSDMLYEAAVACGFQAQPAGGRDYMGVHLNKRDYWIGINYDRPEILAFYTNYKKVDPEAAARLGIEGVYEWRESPGQGWRRDLNLQSEEVHFFSRSKASQMQFLENFLRECLAVVKRIELPDTGTAPPDAADAEPEDHGLT